MGHGYFGPAAPVSSLVLQKIMGAISRDSCPCSSPSLRSLWKGLQMPGYSQLVPKMFRPLPVPSLQPCALHSLPCGLRI